jgi:tetratricopeptide (TPR) repeat protein
MAIRGSARFGVDATGRSPVLWPVLVLTAAMLMAAPARAGEESVSAVFLDEPAGARPSALGGAFAAVAEDVNAVYWNPAALSRVQRKELLLSHTQALVGFRNEYAAFGLPLSAEESLGFNAFFAYSDPIDRITDANADAGTFSTQDLYASVVYSRALGPQWAVGAGVKGIYQQIDVYHAWSVAADLGVLASDVYPGLQLALVVRNLGKPMVFIEESHPLNLGAELGAAYRVWERRLLLTAGVAKPLFQEMLLKAGAEGEVIEDTLFLRAGYRYYQSGNVLGALTGLSLGLGVRISEYSLDYAFLPFEDLGDVHKLAITLPFGRSLVEEQEMLAKLERQVKEKQRRIFDDAVRTGDECAAQGEYALAQQAYARALGIDPQDAAVKRKLDQAEAGAQKRKAADNLKRAQAAYAQQDYLTAMVEATKALDLAPDEAAAKQVLAQANQKLLQEKLSGETSQHKAQIEQYYQQGVKALQQGRYGDSLEAWKKILTLDPNNQRVTQYLRVTRSKLEDLTQDLLELADREWAGGQYVSAVKKWRQVLDMVPDQPAAKAALAAHQSEIKRLAGEYYHQGLEGYVQGRLTEAVADFQNVLVLDPGNVQAQKNLDQTQKKMRALESLQ